MKKNWLLVGVMIIMSSGCAVEKKAIVSQPVNVPQQIAAPQQASAASTPAPQVVSVPPQGTQVTGIVDKVIPLIGTDPPGIVIVDERGEKVKFITGAYSEKTNLNGEPIYMRDFKQGSKVAIIYIVNERGLNKALSVKEIR